MLRIYITESGVEGYNEGCSCCSSTERATIKDIKVLIQKLDNQKYELSLICEMLEDYSEQEIAGWYRIYEELRYEKSCIEAAEKYKADKKVEGTFYKESFIHLSEHKKAVEKLTRAYNKAPSVFKKYIKENQE